MDYEYYEDSFEPLTNKTYFRKMLRENCLCCIGPHCRSGAGKWDNNKSWKKYRKHQYKVPKAKSYKPRKSKEREHWRYKGEERKSSWYLCHVSPKISIPKVSDEEILDYLRGLSEGDSVIRYPETYSVMYPWNCRGNYMVRIKKVTEDGSDMYWDCRIDCMVGFPKKVIQEFDITVDSLRQDYIDSMKNKYVWR